MKKKTSLVIMAAGMGSRYGGLKQLDPVGPNGELLIHYTIYDAHLSGFDRVVFVIRQDFEDEFREKVFINIPDGIKTGFAYQDLKDLPEGRKKPWGTGHAVLVCKEIIEEPFCVVNADDYYGRSSFSIMNKYLISNEISKKTYAMVGYRLKNTISPHGAVTRGLCNVDKSGMVKTIDETHGIETRSGEIGTEANGSWKELDPDFPTSMNMWGFEPGIFGLLDREFSSFLELAKKDMDPEFLIPEVIGSFIDRGFLKLKVLSSDEVWFGMTHPEDKEQVVHEIARMIKEGIYPERLV